MRVLRFTGWFRVEGYPTQEEAIRQLAHHILDDATPFISATEEEREACPLDGDKDVEWAAAWNTFREKRRLEVIVGQVDVDTPETVDEQARPVPQ
jgi:hypothetical protein